MVDPFLRRGYRFKGRAEVVADPAILNVMAKSLGKVYPIQNIVKMRVDEALPVCSPVYAYTDLAESQVKEMWLERYGYQPRAEAETK